jgi:hypothetical protein
MTSLPNPDDELRRAIVNYRVKCDMAFSELQDGFYTEDNYKKAIEWELERVIALIKSEKQALLDCLQAGVPEKWNANPDHPDLARGHNMAVDQFNATIEDVRKGL